jgi:hypothetical protein
VTASTKFGLVGILLAALASRAPGQTASGFGYGPFWQRPLHIGLDLGSAIPTGDLGQAFSPAWNFGANIAWPFTRHGGGWLQADFDYASEIPKSGITGGYGASTGYGSITSGTLNVVLNKRNYLGNFTPYIVFGGGAYWRAVVFDNYVGTGYCNAFVGFCGTYGGAVSTRSRTQFVPGGDAGGGVRYRLPPVALFLEARFNTLATQRGSTTFVPIVAGAEF